MRGYIETGQAEGARLVVGGTDMPDGLERGWYVRPTLFADADNSMRIAREEIFGPVLTVIPYADEDDAVAIANDSDYGLAGSVWTDDTDRGVGIAERIRTGTFGVNQGYTMDPFAPFGGVKASGYGRELGREGIDGYTDTKSIAVAGGKRSHDRTTIDPREPDFARPWARAPHRARIYLGTALFTTLVFGGMTVGVAARIHRAYIHGGRRRQSALRHPGDPPTPGPSLGCARREPNSSRQGR